MHNRNRMMGTGIGGCEPMKPPAGGGFQPIRSLVSELQTIGPEDYRGVWITLKGTLGSSASSANLSYRVPATHSLIIEKMMAHMIITDFSAETADMGNIGSSALTGPMDFNSRMLAKLMNVKVTLQNSDRNAPIFENGYASLLALWRNPVDWTQKPHVVPSGELLDGTVALIDSDSAIYGASTEYGIILIGSLIRTRNS